MVNFREGMRRLGTALGVLGAAAGVFGSYSSLNYLHQRSLSHREFERLVASQSLRSFCHIDYEIRGTVYQFPCTYSDEQVERILLKTGVIKDKESFTGDVFEQVARENARAPKASPENPRQVGTDGILRVHFDELEIARDHRLLPERIDWIETDRGVRIYRTEQPSRKLYWGASVLPLLGFLMPWGIVKAITWIGAGFVASRL